MTNAEYYLKEGTNIDELRKDINSFMSLYGEFDTTDFFNEQRQPTLTEDERVILKNIDMNAYQKITRDETFALILFGKDEEEQIFRCDFDCYNHLFTFIEERRRI
jgi:hypothetical protein